MDPEFGDDLLGGFSGPSDVEYSQSSDEDQAEKETNSLDLLSAMLEGTTKVREKRSDRDTNVKGREKRKRKETEHKSDKSSKRRKDESGGCSKEMVDSVCQENGDSENVSEMKARMKEMEAELSKLRQQVSSPPEPKKQSSPRVARPFVVKRTQSEQVTTGERTRVSHRPPPLSQPSLPNLNRSSNNHQSVSHDSVPLDRDLSSRLISQRKTDEQNGVLTEKYSGLRIRNPLVSSEQMSQRMNGRKMIKITRIPSRIRGDDIEGDWVTIGVIVDKLPPRDTKKGDKYAVWKLSDLSGQAAVVSVFMFGKAYQEHWKTPLGRVVALLNPSIMPNREGGSVNTSGGKTDPSTVALSLDHPKKLMLMGVSQDFTICKAQTKSGNKCTNFAKASDGGYCDYHTQSAYSRTRSHRMEFQNGYGPNSGKLQDKLFKNSKTDMFFCGGQTYIASGKSKRSAAANNHRGSPSERLFVPGAKQSAARAMEELREQRENEGGMRVTSGKGVVTQEGSDIFKQMLQNQSAGARMLTKHMEKEEVIKKEAEGCRPTEKSALQLLKDHKVQAKHTQCSSGPLSPPMLGRGFGPGGVVNLGSPATNKKTSLAKIKALNLVRREGPIKRSNPDGSDRGNTKQSTIMKKVHENREMEEDDETTRSQSKRQKINSEDMERILNAKSSHDWIVKETELEVEQEYFERLEKKENMEQKLQSIKELRVSVVQCKECNYIAEFPGERCKNEKHHLSRFKAVKKCYECKNCHERSFVFTTRPPVDNCRKCGGTSYEQSSLYRERKGPKLPTEQLKLRGDEEKFLH